MKKLVCYTLSYPYGRAEQSFLQPEMELLQEYFDEIYLVPLSADNKKVSLNEKLKLIDLPEGQVLDKKLFIKRFLTLSFQDFSRRPLKFLKIIRSYMSYVKTLCLHQQSLERALYKLELTGENTVHYSYWLNDWATILSGISTIPSRLKVSRAHGFDLYEERSQYGFQLFRQSQLDKFHKVFTVSEMGRRHLGSIFPSFSSKIEVARLGSPSLRHIVDRQRSNTYRLHSCSSLIPLKRVDRIIETLRHSKSRIHWTHAGDGPEKQQILEQAKMLPEHVSYEFLGHLEWKENLKYYEDNWIDLFIHFSSSEGIPVAIMEALSAGIPVMATNVGGVPEIVNDPLLVAENEIGESLAKRIDKLLSSGKSRESVYREQLRDFWSKNYSAEVNYKKFASYLQSLI